MVNFSKIVIYKFVCNDLAITHTYVGSTSNFTQRKGLHKRSCNSEDIKFKNQKIYKIIRENGGWDNWKMIEIEKFPCENGNQARTRERELYEELNANMNMRKPITTREEYYQLNRTDKINYQKEYNELNKIKISDYKKQHYADNTEAILEERKLYYVNNLAKITEYQDKYRERKRLEKQNTVNAQN